CALLHARILLRQRLLLRDTRDQLLRHAIKLLFELANFVGTSHLYTLPVVTIGEACRGAHQRVETAHQAARGDQAEDPPNRCGNHEREQDATSQSPCKLQWTASWV